NKKLETSIHKEKEIFYLVEIPNGENGVILILTEKEYEILFTEFGKLKELTQELESIMNLIGEIVTITDEKGIVLRANAACEKLLGIQEHYFVGKSVFEHQESGIFSSSSTAKVIKTKRMATVTQFTKSDKR